MTLINRHLLKITPYQPGKPVEEVRRELGLTEVIKLASNENPYGPSPKAVSAMRGAARQVNRYPEGSCFYLRKALAERLGVCPENLAFGNGSDEILDLVIKAFAGGSRRILTSEKTFMEYKLTAQIHNIGIREIPLKDFKYDLDAMGRAADKKTKVIFIANPNNPTGTYVGSRRLLGFLSRLPEDTLTVIDEAYVEYVTKNDFPRTLKYIKSKNIIILRTFSKAYGLAGLRIGYAIAREELIDAINRVRQPFNVNLMAQRAAAAALSDGAYLKKIVSANARGRRFFCEEFDRLGLEYVPSEANFVLVNVNCSAKRLFRKLLYAGIIVRPMSMYGLGSFIRVTVGTPAENERFIRALKKSLQEGEP